MQVSKATRLIPLAANPVSPICPLQAILQINQSYPVPDHCPMFSYMDKVKLIIISKSQAWLVIFKLLSPLGLNAKNYGFHTFRRIGASLVFSLNIQGLSIWSSDAIWFFLDQSLSATVLTSTIVFSCFMLLF